MSHDQNAGSWTSAQLIAAIRQAANLPDTASDWSDATILAEATKVIQWFGTWALSTGADGRAAEMFNRNVEAALSSPYRASSDFELPPLAVGDAIEGVVWVNADGTKESPLTLISALDRHYWDTPNASGSPMAYSFGAGRITVYPQPTEGGMLRFHYQRRQPDLIVDSPASVGTVSSIADLGGGYTRFNLSAGPTFTVGSYVDLLNSQLPYRCTFSTVYVNASSSSYVDLFLPYSYLSSITPAGMRLVRSGESPYVHLPLEMKSAIEDKTAAVILRKTGDLVGSASSNAAATEAMQLVMRIIDPRSKQQRKKAYHPNSLMRRRMWGR